MDLERLNLLFKAAGITKKELAKLLDINAQSIYAWESTQNAPYWIWSWLENYAKARMFDRMMELGKTLQESTGVGGNVNTLLFVKNNCSKERKKC